MHFKAATRLLLRQRPRDHSNGVEPQWQSQKQTENTPNNSSGTFGKANDCRSKTLLRRNTWLVAMLTNSILACNTPSHLCSYRSMVRRKRTNRNKVACAFCERPPASACSRQDHHRYNSGHTSNDLTHRETTALFANALCRLSYNQSFANAFEIKHTTI